MIARPDYLEKLIRYKDKDLIKVITGIRRCGKSVLLFDIYARYLLNLGILEDHILRLLGHSLGVFVFIISSVSCERYAFHLALDLYDKFHSNVGFVNGMAFQNVCLDGVVSFDFAGTDRDRVSD